MLYQKGAIFHLFYYAINVSDRTDKQAVKHTCIRLHYELHTRNIQSKIECEQVMINTLTFSLKHNHITDKLSH